MVYKKYVFLDSKMWLVGQLEKKSVMQLAKELSEQTGVPAQVLHGCITQRVNRWFTTEEKQKVKRQRRPNIAKNTDTIEE